MTWFRNYEAEALRERIDELKKSHERELTRVITELQETREEYQRLVRTVLPAMQSTLTTKEMKEEDEKPAPLETGFSLAGGTPFDRVKALWIKEQQEEEEKAKKKQPSYVFTGDGPVKT